MIDLRYRAAPNGRIGDQLNSELLEISPDDRMPAIVDDDPVSDHERKTRSAAPLDGGLRRCGRRRERGHRRIGRAVHARGTFGSAEKQSRNRETICEMSA